jgi:HJR/Mrr/RecB family endonuclease
MSGIFEDGKNGGNRSEDSEYAQNNDTTSSTCMVCYHEKKYDGLIERTVCINENCSEFRAYQLLRQNAYSKLYDVKGNVDINPKLESDKYSFYVPKLKQSIKLDESDLQNNFTRITWREMEELVGELLRKKRYRVEVTQASGDFGIDVEAKNGSEYLGIQVKHWANDVGFEDVAKTLGVAQKFNKVIIVSTKSGFTSQAWKHARDNPYLIELWDSSKFKDELRNYFLK